MGIVLNKCSNVINSNVMKVVQIFYTDCMSLCQSVLGKLIIYFLFVSKFLNERRSLIDVYKINYPKNMPDIRPVF